MKKVCITPSNKSIAIRAEAVEIINLFISKGFDDVKGFRNVVIRLSGKFENYERVRDLDYFWQLRKFDADLNNELREVLDLLETENAAVNHA